MKNSVAYFPKGLRYCTPLIIAGGALLLAISSFVWGTIMILLALIILTTKYVTLIDVDKRRYDDYISLLGVKLSNESGTFKQFDRIVITKGSYQQTINTRVQSRRLDWTDYTATLLFDGGASLDLLTRTSKEELLKGLKVFADKLNVEVEDRSTREPYFVDMKRL